MGNTPSGPVRTGSPDVPLFALIFRSPDEIRLIMAPPEVHQLVRQSAMNVHGQALQDAGYSEKGWFFLQFKGEPFSQNSSSEEAIFSRELAVRILYDLYAQGWVLYVSAKMSRHWNLTSWFFHRGAPRAPAPMICVALSNYDSLQLVGCDTSLFHAIADVAQRSYAAGIQNRGNLSQMIHVLKFNGNPWKPSDTLESVSARVLLLNIIELLHRRQFRLYTTADVKDTCDSIFFMLDPQSNLVDAEFFCLSLDASDLFRLINCDEGVYNAVLTTVQQNWPKGLQEQKEIRVNGAKRVWEIKLRGNPWYSGDQEATDARRLICKIFEVLLTRGWCLLSSLDVSRKDQDKGIFIFRNCSKANALHSSLGFFDQDTVRVINADQSLTDTVRRVASSVYPLGVQNEGERCNSHQIVFNGDPFCGGKSGNKKPMHAAVMMCHWLYELNKVGWHVLCGADVSARFIKIKSNRSSSSTYREGHGSGDEYKQDVHSWFLAYIGAPRVF